MKKVILDNKLLIAILVGLAFFAWRWYGAQHPSPAAIPTSSVLIVGTNAEYPPYTFIEDGKIVGFDIDLMEEVAKRLGKTIEWRDMPFSTLLPQLQLGSIQAIAAGMSPTPERAQQVLFTRPYLTNGTFVIVAKKGTPMPDHVKELHNQNVVVNEGFVADFYLTDNGVHARKLPTIAEAFLALDRDRARFFVTAQSTVKPFFDQYGNDRFEVHPLTDSKESIAFAISPAHPELAEQITRILEQLAEDGTLVSLKRRWKLED